MYTQLESSRQWLQLASNLSLCATIAIFNLSCNLHPRKCLRLNQPWLGLAQMSCLLWIGATIARKIFEPVYGSLVLLNCICEFLAAVSLS